MKPDFAHILSNLRHENSLSQKKAADELGVSQALLSHYENGVREPKLEFIIRACEYYGVTTDYILGRTAERTYDGVSLRCQGDCDRRNADAASLIIALLSEIGDAPLSQATARYMNYSIFVILSALRSSRRQYEPLFDASFKAAEADFIENARRVLEGGDVREKLSDALLREKYPKQYGAVLEMEEIIKKAVLSLKQTSENS
ncbi:DNA-binding transcriptional regulator, XRE-family HTH domain [Sporobacter termitidis DSM 10068]|uniref:DNA-binding transcriptional regulator, XRE-family HTH domain n=1 Tax=Sporobacter termitidis DSM 10068 TaxID=1123282 RepID=A0A1M5VPD2_9FIRM|nr:helix-turn-helix transcriptional regulator [Sporobacter termitidis]SHH77050.1 DNA-binding transcriptional regulator, XRE-family HTH domain [Sporobacter termitidis DSM 10068]